MLSFSNGKAVLASAPKAPPNVAPIKSEGEKIPPDELEARLEDVAVSLRAKSRASRVARPPSNTSWTVA
jgi:hypothetical protein